MSVFKDIYDVLKDLMVLANKAGNQEMISLSLKLQTELFDLRDEIEKVKEENKTLNEELERFQKPEVNESDIDYYANGFLTLNHEKGEFPYCTYCWKTKRRLIPLCKQGAWWKFQCPDCKSTITVEGRHGEEFR